MGIVACHRPRSPWSPRGPSPLAPGAATSRRGPAPVVRPAPPTPVATCPTTSAPDTWPNPPRLPAPSDWRAGNSRFPPTAAWRTRTVIDTAVPTDRSSARRHCFATEAVPRPPPHTASGTRRAWPLCDNTSVPHTPRAAVPRLSCLTTHGLTLARSPARPPALVLRQPRTRSGCWPPSSVPES